MSMTDQQRQLVTESFAHLVPISEEAAAMFYERLWEIAPETKALFQHVEMRQQGLKLMQTLGVTVRSLHDLDNISPMLYELGQRHIGYGVGKEQYDLVKDALLWMIENVLGATYTPEVQAAWDAAYDLIASLTLRAYD